MVPEKLVTDCFGDHHVIEKARGDIDPTDLQQAGDRRGVADGEQSTQLPVPLSRSRTAASSAARSSIP